MTYLQNSTCCGTECMQGSPMFACGPDEKKHPVHATLQTGGGGGVGVNCSIIKNILKTPSKP